MLKIWRRSSPHNWWIESKRGKQLWHSGGVGVPDLRLFRLLKDSNERVVQYWGADSGRPEMSIYVFVGGDRTSEGG